MNRNIPLFIFIFTSISLSASQTDNEAVSLSVTLAIQKMQQENLTNLQNNKNEVNATLTNVNETIATKERLKRSQLLGHRHPNTRDLNELYTTRAQLTRELTDITLQIQKLT